MAKDYSRAPVSVIPPGESQDHEPGTGQALQAIRDQYEADKRIPDGPSLPEPGAPRAYSVLLSIPEYVSADDSGDYYIHVQGHTVDDAIAAARRDCLADNTDAEGNCFIDRPDDITVRLVIEGYHPDVKP